MRRLFILVSLCATVLSSTQLIAQTPTVPSTSTQPTQALPSENDLQELTRLLGDERIQAWLQAQVNQTELPEAAAQQTLREQIAQVSEDIGARVASLGAAWSARAGIQDVVEAHWQEQLPPAVQVRSLSFVLIFLFIGFGLEWLVRQYTNPVRRRLEVAQYEATRDRVNAGLVRTGLAFLGLFAFTLGSVGAYSAFTWPPLLNTLILNVLMVIVITRATGSVLLLLLAPWAHQLRLVPLGTPVAMVLWRVIVLVLAIVLVCGAAADVFEDLIEQADLQSAEALAISVASALVILLVSVTGLLLVFRAVRMHEPKLSPKAMRTWRAYLVTICVVVFLLWLINLEALMWTVALLGLLFPSLALVSAWVTSAFDTAAAEFQAKRLKERQAQAQLAATSEDSEVVSEEDEAEEEDVIDPYRSYRPLAVRLARFGVIIIVGLSLATVWNVGLFETIDNPTFTQRAFEILLDSAFALLIADLLWTWGKSVIDRRLANYKPPEDNKAPGPEARIATLLPLLRVVLQATLLSVVIMTVLTAAGVNIAPIIAGAGVIGIAIGFGAQSLVKDVVSGIFFLIDDAFRVGEYVEIDNLRGTVEKISIRSLQLRHHRGAVHTLPFGELKSLTNHSRDWVIMKLEFRVPFETDLKLVKKLIKQVGAQLKEHPEYGDSILETLKSQGVRRMEEFNMVVGVKFMTRPGEQWLVRRDAYQGVRDIFEANGIRMAERNVKVEIAGDGDLDDEAKKAVSAAAQQAIEQPQQPNTPIPDEP